MNMHKKDSFPYLKSLHINDCFTYKDFDINIYQEQPFKHLILTGKNGSGKTSILEGLAERVYTEYISGKTSENRTRELESVLSSNPDYPDREKLWASPLEKLNRTRTLPNIYIIGQHPFDTRNVVFSFFKANRRVSLEHVDTITKDDFITKRATEPTSNEQDTKDLSSAFKQFIVNKKVYQAFSILEENIEEQNIISKFFSDFTNILREIFQDKKLYIEFIRENFDFIIYLSNNRKTTFEKLSNGFSAYINIIMDLLMRVDIIRKKLNDYTYDPCGIVIIDEPENHMHIEMQYQVLPLLTRLFPNVQFVVATHSPAVISSIINATIYDLSSRAILGDEAVGSSYSELMLTHFGLDNEYSAFADSIIESAKEIINNDNIYEAKQALINLIQNNKKYMTPVLRLEMESQLIKLIKKHNLD